MLKRWERFLCDLVYIRSVVECIGMCHDMTRFSIVLAWKIRAGHCQTIRSKGHIGLPAICSILVILQSRGGHGNSFLKFDSETGRSLVEPARSNSSYRY